MEEQTVEIKIGGRAAADPDSLISLFREIAALSGPLRFLLVHGGGAEVTELSKLMGHQSVFVDGVRMTSREEMPAVDMVLAGRMNKHLVRLSRKAGMTAVGMSGVDGGLFTGRSIDGASRTGIVGAVDPELIRMVMGQGWIPIVASVSMDEDGEPLNINADEAAFHIAAALPAGQLIFISDIPGILKNGTVLDSLTDTEIEAEIANGTISGGMIPKVRSSLDALERGVRHIIIGEYQRAGDLGRLLSGESGTRIRRAAEE